MGRSEPLGHTAALGVLVVELIRGEIRDGGFARPGHEITEISKMGGEANSNARSADFSDGAYRFDTIGGQWAGVYVTGRKTFQQALPKLGHGSCRGISRWFGLWDVGT
jgi:hypothetical protein